MNWMFEWIEWINESNGLMKGLDEWKEWMNERNGWIKEMDEWIELNGRMNWMDEWNEWMNDFLDLFYVDGITLINWMK
jgi:hypothetical protein